MQGARPKLYVCVSLSSFASMTVFHKVKVIFLRFGQSTIVQVFNTNSKLATIIIIIQKVKGQ